MLSIPVCASCMLYVCMYVCMYVCTYVCIHDVQCFPFQYVRHHGVKPTLCSEYLFVIRRHSVSSSMYGYLTACMRAIAHMLRHARMLAIAHIHTHTHMHVRYFTLIHNFYPRMLTDMHAGLRLVCIHATLLPYTMSKRAC
jgi:hypothetical protein